MRIKDACQWFSPVPGPLVSHEETFVLLLFLWLFFFVSVKIPVRTAEVELGD